MLELQKYLTKREIDEIEILASRLNAKDRRNHYWTHENGIVDFVLEVLRPKELYTYQIRILKNFRKHQRVSVKSLRGVGKTAMASFIVLWLISCCPTEVKAITTASVWEQLDKYLWPEIRKWALRANWQYIGLTMRDGDEILLKQISLESGRKLAFATSPGKPERIEGAHAETLLYVLDEAKIIPDSVFDAIEGAFSTKGTNAFVFCISTPGAPLGRFYDIHRGRIGLENWHTENITLQEALEAGVIDLEHVESMKRLWGEDSPLYKNHFLGEFAESSDFGIIKLSWVQAANARWHELQANKPTGDRLWGIDPADTGMDKTAITPLIDNYFEYVKYYNEEVMRTSQRLIELGFTCKFNDEGFYESGDQIAIDGLSVGAGLYQTLRGKNYRIHNVKFSGKAVDRVGNRIKDSSGMNTFQNIKIAAYWALREALDPESPAFANIALPPDEDLTRDLIVHEWTESMGVLRMKESKDKIREKIGRSPDGGDAVAIAWWIRSQHTRKRTSKVIQL